MFVFHKYGNTTFFTDNIVFHFQLAIYLSQKTCQPPVNTHPTTAVKDYPPSKAYLSAMCMLEYSAKSSIKEQVKRIKKP